VHFVAFLEQEVSKVTPVLAGNACDQRFLHERRFALKQTVGVSKRISFPAVKS
jgi:hypothetical protein